MFQTTNQTRSEASEAYFTRARSEQQLTDNKTWPWPSHSHIVHDLPNSHLPNVILWFPISSISHLAMVDYPRVKSTNNIPWFPEIGVPLVIILFYGILHYKPTILRVPPWLWKPPYTQSSTSRLSATETHRAARGPQQRNFINITGVHWRQPKTMKHINMYRSIYLSIYLSIFIICIYIYMWAYNHIES